MKQKQPTKGRSEGRSAFLAQKEAVRAALREGLFMTEIYESMRGQLPFSYPQFTRHVRRHLAADLASSAGQTAVPPKPALPAIEPPRLPLNAPAAPTPGAPREAKAERPRTFQHNPVPDTDKLI